MFEWLKKWLNSQNTETTTSVVEPSKNQTELGCKLHPDYLGSAPPTNNCNSCWQFYSKQRKW
jgi:hypothetical protein